MHRQRHSTLKHPPKYSKLKILAAFLLVCLLPYALLKTFVGKKNNAVRQVTTSPISELQLTATETLSEDESPTQIEAPEPVIQQPIELPKPVEKTAPLDEVWKDVQTRSGDSLASIFKRVGLNGQTLHAILQKNPHAPLLTRIKPNQSIQFLIKKNQLERMVIKGDHGQSLEVVREHAQFKTTLHAPKKDTRERYLTATVQYSLYSTAKRQGIPYKLIQQMSDIFKREMNFAKDVRGGDRFSIIYQASYVDNQLVSVGDIIAVTYTHQGISHQALRHVNPEGDAEYFTPEGKSMKQGFSRYPIKFLHINSAFSLSRMHPVLHYHRPHKGVDLAAPIGTPIHATGDGKVVHLGYENGYGNVIKIAHHNALYTSVYAHLSKFKKGLFRGTYVKRGEVIGYVGKSGLATGPHCHYEFHVNHRPKNPSTVPLPTANSVPRRDLASFKAHADKLIEHLKLFEEAHLASKKDSAVG
jgi:murein DD-endopeptidase MepM/ murein hydrolase activator NlpD